MEKTIYITLEKEIEVIKNKHPKNNILYLGENFKKSSRLQKIDLVITYYFYYREEKFKIIFICPKKLINDYNFIIGLSDDCIVY